MDKLQWGNRKRQFFVKLKDSPLNGKSDYDGGGSGAVLKKKINSREIFSHPDMNKLQWGKRKRIFFVKVQDSPLNGKSEGDGGSSGKKKITSRVVDNNITYNVNNCSKDGNVLPPVPSPYASNSENPCIMETRVCSRKNIKLRDEDCWIDQISRLPDELLVSILSCLSLKEAVASSILSRRWRFLWTFISKLDFEGSDMWTTFTSKQDFDIRGCLSLSKWDTSSRECWEYVGWVDNLLGLRDKSAAAIEELRISFSLNKAHQSYIDKWISFALDKKVVRLDMNLNQTCPARPYTFPYKLLCGNESHTCGFKDLRLIRMVSVTLSDGALEIFLRSCPLLEEIFFARCYGLSTVKIVNPLPALKRLTIIRCYDLESVEVRNLNLEYFMFRCGVMPLKHFLLKNVPLLVEMNVGGVAPLKVEEFLAMFSSCLPLLEKLTMERCWTFSIMEADMICSSVKMSNLKQLVWKYSGFSYGVMNLEGLSILASSLPLLQRLVVMSCGDVRKGIVDRFYTHRWRYRRTYTYSSHLKQVEFVGYHGDLDEMSFVAYVLENAAALEEVIIHPAKETNIDGVFGEYTEHEIDAFRAFAKEQLTSRVPSTVTLKIL